MWCHKLNYFGSGWEGGIRDLCVVLSGGGGVSPSVWVQPEETRFATASGKEGRKDRRCKGKKKEGVLVLSLPIGRKRGGEGITLIKTTGPTRSGENLTYTSFRQRTSTRMR